MKAVLLTNHGGPEMLRYGEAPDPTAGPGEVVVDVYAASVNAADSKVRQGGGRYFISGLETMIGARALAAAAAGSFGYDFRKGQCPEQGFSADYWSSDGLSQVPADSFRRKQP
ncbi:MAG: hypothetical protein WBX78_00190 [Pseudolabrys sp.]